MPFSELITKHGPLYITRLDLSSAVLKSERRRHVALLDTHHLLSYYSGSDMHDQLGCLDLRYATLDDGTFIKKHHYFIITQANAGKVFKFTERKKPEVLLEWYNALKGAIAAVKQPEEYILSTSDIQGAYTCNMIVRSSRMDEITASVEYEIWCHCMFISKHTNSKVQTRWSAWRTVDEFRFLDEQLRLSLGWQMDSIEFPRERKRDAILGAKSKSAKDNKVHALNEYLQKIHAIANVTEFHKHHGSIDLRDFIMFDLGFGEDITLRAQKHSERDLVEKESSSSSTTEKDVEGERKSSLAVESEQPAAVEQHTQPSVQHRGSKFDDDEDVEVDATVADSDIELVSGKEAETLNAAIIEAVGVISEGNKKQIKSFKVQTRSFGEGSITVAEYFEYLMQSFGPEFTVWIVKDIVHLVPDVQKRRDLFLVCERASESMTKEIQDKKLNDCSIPVLKAETIAAVVQGAQETVEHASSPARRKSHSPPVSQTEAHSADASFSAYNVQPAPAVEPTPKDERSVIPLDVAFETDSVKAQALHQHILDSINELFHRDEERVMDFQDQTKGFGKGQISAAEYVSYFQGAVGLPAARSLILDMAKLLPDQVKRQDLLSCLHRVDRRANKLKKKRSKQFSAESTSFSASSIPSAPSPLELSVNSSSGRETRHDVRFEEPSLETRMKSSLSIDEKEKPRRRSHRKSRKQSQSTPIDYQVKSTAHSTHSSSNHSHSSQPKTAPAFHSDKDRRLSTEDQAPVSHEETDPSESHNAPDFREENPVLARLRKQGAVDFLGGLPR